MKNIFKTILALTLITGFASCDNDENLMFVTPPASFQILSPSTGAGVILDPLTPNNPALSLTWEGANYGTATEVTYVVQVDKIGDEFDTPIDIASTTNTYVTITSEELNNAADEVNLTPFEEDGLEVRIMATVGTTGSEPSYSNVITYLVTSYSTDMPLLSVPGAYQGANWDPNTADRVAASAYGKTDYQGYIWLDGEFLFTAPNADGVFTWDVKWGQGAAENTLLLGSNTNCTAVSAGYYLVKADTAPDKLTYSATLTNWGVIGSATPGGWDNSTPMTYDSTTKKWTVVMTLAGGQQFKFRANNDWGINLGAFDPGKPGVGDVMSYDGSNIDVAASGTYLVTLDLSSPRAYTFSFVAQ